MPNGTRFTKALEKDVRLCEGKVWPSSSGIQWDSVGLSAPVRLCTFRPPAEGCAGVHHEDEENWVSFLNKGGPSVSEDGWGWGKLVTLKPKDKRLAQCVIEVSDARMRERSRPVTSVEQAGSSRTPVPDVRLLTRYPNQQKDCSISIEG